MSMLAPAKNRPLRQSAIFRTRSALHSDGVANILSMLAQATTEEEQVGITWYSTAHVLASHWHPDMRTACGVLAALSPNTDWESNVAMAADFLAGHTDADTVPHTYDAGRKAERIRDGEDPDLVLGGRKVRSFFRNIFDPDRPGPVTVDRHATCIWLGERDTSRRPVNLVNRVGAYQMIAADYRTAGRLTGLLPHQIQAITWCTYRRIHVPPHLQTGEF